MLDLANYSATAWQGGLVVPKQDEEHPTTIWEFNTESQEWIELGAWPDANFPLPPVGRVVLKFSNPQWNAQTRP